MEDLSSLLVGLPKRGIIHSFDYSIVKQPLKSVYTSDVSGMQKINNDNENIILRTLKSKQIGKDEAKIKFVTPAKSSRKISELSQSTVSKNPGKNPSDLLSLSPIPSCERLQSENFLEPENPLEPEYKKQKVNSPSICVKQADPVDFQNASIKTLRDYCKVHHLHVSGSKADLLNRIVKNLSQTRLQ